MKEYQEAYLSNKTCYRHHKVLISAKKSNDRLPNYHFSFLRKSFTKPSTGWISHFSIFSGSRFLKFRKKGSIPSNVSIKLPASPDFITRVNLSPLIKPI